MELKYTLIFVYMYWIDRLKLSAKTRYFLYIKLSKIFNILVNYDKHINLYRSKRRAGNTTRMVDLFVQEFFNKGNVEIFDHYNTRESNKRVFYWVLNRLNIEHGITEKDVFLDRNRFIIRRKQQIK